MLFTDLAALGWFIPITDPLCIIMSWRLGLAEFDFHIQNNAGKNNTQTDALLRLQTAAETISDDEEDLPTSRTTFSCQRTTPITPRWTLKQYTRSTLNTTWNILHPMPFSIIPVLTQLYPLFQQISAVEFPVPQIFDSFCHKINQNLE